MKIAETYNGHPIYQHPTSKKLPYSTVQEVGGIMGVIETGHKTIEDARAFIDKVYQPKTA